jgi:hypothetical protein
MPLSLLSIVSLPISFNTFAAGIAGEFTSVTKLVGTVGGTGPEAKLLYIWLKLIYLAYMIARLKIPEPAVPII